MVGDKIEWERERDSIFQLLRNEVVHRSPRHKSRVDGRHYDLQKRGGFNLRPENYHVYKNHGG